MKKFSPSLFFFFLLFTMDLFFPSPFKVLKNYLIVVIFLFFIFFIFLKNNFYIDVISVLKRHKTLFFLFLLILLNLFVHNFHIEKGSIFKNFLFLSTLYVGFDYFFKNINLKDFLEKFEFFLSFFVVIEFFISLIQFFYLKFLTSIFITEGTYRQIFFERKSFGTFSHPNFLGTFMAISSIYFLFNLNRGRLNKIFFSLSFLGVIFSKSRGAFFSLILVILIFLFFNFFLKDFNKRRKFTFLFFIFFALSQIATFLIFEKYFFKKRLLCFTEEIVGGIECSNFTQNGVLLKIFDVNGDGKINLKDEISILNFRDEKCEFVKWKRKHLSLFKKDIVSFRKLLEFKDVSSINRLFIFKSCLLMVRDFPFMGVGVGNYVKYIKNYTFAPEFYAFNIYHPHNFYLLILCEFGIFMGGVIIFLFFLFIYKNFKFSPYYFAILYIFLHLFFDVTFYAEGVRILLPLFLNLCLNYQQIPSYKKLSL